MRLREVGLQLGFRTDPSFLLCFKHLFLHNIVTYRTDASYRYEDKRDFMRALRMDNNILCKNISEYQPWQNSNH